MARRKHKNNKSTLIALVVVVAIAWAWEAYQSRVEARQSHTEATSPTRELYGNLERVIAPAGVNEELIDYPGFTVSFNAKHHQPNYVTWELTRDEVNTNVVGKRSNNFQPDPNVKGCPTLDDYRNSGYDRGHMCPSGDMKWDSEAADACFLLTNMSPQSHDLNNGAWKTLEENCRRWATRDGAIYIVCGPILTDRIANRIGQSRVSVPKRYFKVVISPYADPPMGIGFIMPNGRVEGGLQPTAVSIDEVERVTGYDFFSALPDDIEDAIEAQCNFPAWNKN